MDPYGPIGTPMDPYGPLWTHMDPYGPLWTHMDPYGPIWTHMDPYGPIIWTHMDPYGPLWTPMDPYGRLWNRGVLIKKPNYCGSRVETRVALQQYYHPWGIPLVAYTVIPLWAAAHFYPKKDDREFPYKTSRTFFFENGIIGNFPYVESKTFSNMHIFLPDQNLRVNSHQLASESTVTEACPSLKTNWGSQIPPAEYMGKRNRIIWKIEKKIRRHPKKSVTV